MTRPQWIRTAFGLTLASTLVMADGAAQAQADRRFVTGRTQWLNRQYPPARTTLLDYRRAANARTAQVDYMLGTSGCRIGSQRDWGANVLDFVLYRYQLTPQSRAIIERERSLCRSQTPMPRLEAAAVTLATRPQAGATWRGKSGIRFDPERPIYAFPARTVAPVEEAALQRRLVPLDSGEAIREHLQDLKPAQARTSVIGRYAFVTSGGHTDAQLSTMRERLDRYRDFLEASFGIAPADRYTSIYLVSNQAELVDLARRIHGLEVDHYTIGYSYQDDQSIVAVVPGNQIGTLFHEFFHIAVRNNFGDVPQWVDEGLAALYEVSSISPDGQVLGLPNWREEILTNLWDKRPTIEQLITAEWFASDTPSIEGPAMPTEVADDRQTLTDMIAIQHATARYFMLFLQQRGKLGNVYQVVRGLEPGDADPKGAAVRAVIQQVGPLARLQSDFDQWFLTTRGRSATSSEGERIDKFEPDPPRPDCRLVSPAQQSAC